MTWRSVIKTVKGRHYLYRQRSWREGDKVRTQSVYVGPFTDDRQRSDNASPAGAALTEEEYLAASDRPMPEVQESVGTSTASKPKRRPRRRRTPSSAGNERVMSLGEFRKVNPDAYKELEARLRQEHEFGKSRLRKYRDRILANDDWKRDAESVIKEMQIHGHGKIFQQRYKRAHFTEKRTDIALRKLNRLRNPEKIKKQKQLVRDWREINRRAAYEHGTAMWVRIYMVGKGPYE